MVKIHSAVSDHSYNDRILLELESDREGSNYIFYLFLIFEICGKSDTIIYYTYTHPDC